MHMYMGMRKNIVQNTLRQTGVEQMALKFTTKNDNVNYMQNKATLNLTIKKYN